MLVQLCGKCAIQQNLPLEDRKQLAEKIIADQVYQCPSCEIHFGLFVNQYVRNDDRSQLPLVENNGLEKKREKQIKKPEKAKIKTVVQTSLF